MNHKAVVEIQVDQCDIPESRECYDDKQVQTRLALNMKSTGQICPILVRPSDEPNKYEVIVGGRRVLAKRLAGEPTIDCIVVDKQLSEAELVKLQWSENAQRVGFNPIEEAVLACRFKDAAGLNGKDAAKELGITSTDMSRYWERVHEWPDELRDAVKTGKIAASTGHAIYKAEPEEKRQELIRQAAEGRLTRDAAEAHAKGVRIDEDATAQPQFTRVKAVLDDDASVTVRAPQLVMDSFVSLLERLLGKARKAKAKNLDLDGFVRSLRKATA